MRGEHMAIDLFDLSNIYNKSGYEYSLPPNVMNTFISGVAFDNKVPYTEEESSNLRKDTQDIYEKIMAQNPSKSDKPLAIMTAGAPGAGKTVLMKQDIEAFQNQTNKKYAYICPDDVCLKSQTRTYLADIKKKPSFMVVLLNFFRCSPPNDDKAIEVRKAAYNKWRPASNAATHLILANLIREKYDFYFGTTSSGPATKFFLQHLKDQGYTIKLLHVSAPDDVRWESIKMRDQTFVQTTEDDVREKGDLVPQRITDTFLKFADQIQFFYRDAVDQDAVLAAEWTRDDNTLIVKSNPLYEKIKAIHNHVVDKLNKPELAWKVAVEDQVILKK